MKRAWLAPLSKVCRQLRDEFRPLHAAQTHVYLNMITVRTFLKAFFHPGSNGTAFGHIKIIIPQGLTGQKRYDILWLIKILHNTPGLDWSITTVGPTGVSDQADYDTLFARNNSLLAYVLPRALKFVLGPRSLDIRVMNEYREPWMSIPWESANYKRVRGQPADMAQRQLATRTWLATAGANLNVLHGWSVTVGTMT